MLNVGHYIKRIYEKKLLAAIGRSLCQGGSCSEQNGIQAGSAMQRGHVGHAIAALYIPHVIV